MESRTEDLEDSSPPSTTNPSVDCSQAQETTHYQPSPDSSGRQEQSQTYTAPQASQQDLDYYFLAWHNQVNDNRSYDENLPCSWSCQDFYNPPPEQSKQHNRHYFCENQYQKPFYYCPPLQNAPQIMSDPNSGQMMEHNPRYLDVHVQPPESDDDVTLFGEQRAPEHSVRADLAVSEPKDEHSRRNEDLQAWLWYPEEAEDDVSEYSVKPEATAGNQSIRKEETGAWISNNEEVQQHKTNEEMKMAYINRLKEQLQEAEARRDEVCSYIAWAKEHLAQHGVEVEEYQTVREVKDRISGISVV